jgi:hypothetical protein
MLTSGADNLNKNIYSNGQNFVDNQIGRENNMLRSASDDATRRTRQLIAQRGMGTSSLGLGQEINQEQNLNEKIALNKSTGLERLRGLYNDQMQTGSQLYNVKAQQGPVQMQDQTARSGGYGQLIAAGIGAAGSYMGAGGGMGK